MKLHLILMVILAFAVSLVPSCDSKKDKQLQGDVKTGSDSGEKAAVDAQSVPSTPIDVVAVPAQDVVPVPADLVVDAPHPTDAPVPADVPSTEVITDLKGAVATDIGEQSSLALFPREQVCEVMLMLQPV